MTPNNTEIPSPLARLPSPMVSLQDNSSAIITVIRDPKLPLGKLFTAHADGTISKKSSVNVAFGIAVMHHVPTHDELAKLLTDVGNDPHAAIINSVFKGIRVVFLDAQHVARLQRRGQAEVEFIETHARSHAGRVLRIR